ncbi:MAG: hypothetical protein ACLPYS_13240, partial [Vulcanimicrobiaceae bacterium]
MKFGRLCLLISSFLLCATERAPAQSTMVPWLTRSADNSRSGWNPNETQLTQASVTSKGISRATIIPVIGDARGMEAQPLILPNVQTSRGTRDVMLLPSMADVVRGVDAHDGSGIWQVTLGTPITGSQSIDSKQVNDHWGCISTGVIDPDTQRLYQVCWISPDQTGNPQTARYYMFVLNVADGTQLVPPVLIEEPSGTKTFNSAMRKQRSALVETNVNGLKTVFGCSGSVDEIQAGASGYCFAFDVASNTVSAMFASSPAGEGGGIWMAAQGAAADAQGFLYVTTGNGAFDGVTLWAESFLKLQYTPSSGGVPAALQIADHWTPWTDLARTGGAAAPAAVPAGASAPSEAIKPVGGTASTGLTNAKLVTNVSAQGTPVLLVFPQIAQGAWWDQDWGSAGPA